MNKNTHYVLKTPIRYSSNRCIGLDVVFYNETRNIWLFRKLKLKLIKEAKLCILNKQLGLIAHPNILCLVVELIQEVVS